MVVMSEENMKNKLLKWRRKTNSFIKKLLVKLFDNPVKIEKNRMIIKYGLDESVERENVYLQQHLEKFRFKLFCFYCVLGFTILFLMGSLLFFWIPRWI